VPLPLRARGDHAREILEQVASGKRVSQRSLARDTGIALGLANLLIHRMVQRGWVRLIRVRRNRIRYLITPAGIAEKARRSRAHFAGSIRYYAQARDRIAQRLLTLSDEWPAGTNGSGGKRIVFCGCGEEAEIGYVCLQGTDLQLVGVIDDQPRKQFFGLPVSPYESLRPGRLADVPFGMIVVMSFADERPIRRRLASVNCSAPVFWI
jgi:DNA-binding MarR family transcriptional regulator